jgi:5'-3' exonuclease
MATYILIDSLNLFMRSRHSTNPKADTNMKIGMAMHIMFSSVRKAWNDFGGDHVVFLLEGRSWRKDFYPPYKANRKVKADQRKPHEVEEDALYMEAYQDLCDYFNNKTNCSVLRNPQAEADDLIATWIQTHPHDTHIIISTDSDFLQLLAPNVIQYNGVTGETIRLEGVFDGQGKPVLDRKTGKPKQIGDPNFVLFEKCVRGDSTDNVFSAYPGARLIGTKNKTGITEAFRDKQTGGYSYNNFMLQRWTDHTGAEVRVKDAYERNRHLIDLTAQPDDIKQSCKETVLAAVQKPQIPNVGIHFMKFAGKYGLDRLSAAATEFGKMLNAGIKNSTSTVLEDSN